MIHNEDELSLARLQLSRIEAALSALKRDVLPKSKGRFKLMTEAYIDQMKELQCEIYDYLDTAESRIKDVAVKTPVRPQGAA